jgi:predicted NodU family carbamoyl transferase
VSDNKYTRFFFWFYRQHRQEVINLLEAIENPPGNIKPTRKLILLPYLLEREKLKKEKDFDYLVQHLINARYADRCNSGALNLTHEGRKILTQYAEFELLRPMKIIQNSLKENLSAILALIAVIISVISLFKTETKEMPNKIAFLEHHACHSLKKNLF